VLFLALVSVVGACAEAGKPGGGPGGTNDASTTPDGSHSPADAAKPSDAASGVCSSNLTCQTAMDLGSVSGDTGNATVTANGYQAGWYKVRVTEDDSGVFGVEMTVTAALTSPGSSNYDVFTYINTGSDVIECNTPSGTASSSGTTDSSKLGWGETGTLSNGANDDRTLTIEVRPISGTCSSAMPWQLVVTGDT
jgi:hypothetical protein